MGIEPTPLWFQVPRDVFDDVLSWPMCDIEPTFLCFETFYQSVARTWPTGYNVIDVGGCHGLQGWLFKRFAGYYDVDILSMASRARLPDNGRHIRRDGAEYMAMFEAFGTFGDNDLFVCSAVPNDRVRDAVRRAPNHVVWYPGEPMDASGTFGEVTVAEFERLHDVGWDVDRDRVVMDALEGEWMV